MENENCNCVQNSNQNKKRTRFSINGKIISPRKNRKSLLAPLLSGSGQSSPISCENSSDVEWAKICNRASNLPEYIDTTDDEFLFNSSVHGFNSPSESKRESTRKSLESLSQEREILHLSKQSAEIDDEIDYYHGCIDEIQQNFISLFSDLQKRRLHTICARKGIPPPNAAQIFSAIESLDLSYMEPIEWAPAIEKAINALIE